MEKVTADVEIVREVEFKVDPEDVNELHSLMIKLLTDEELSIMDEQRQYFPETKTTAGGDAVKTVEMRTKGFRIAAAGFGRIDSNFKRSFTVSKMLPNCIMCYREIIGEKESIDVSDFMVLF